MTIPDHPVSPGSPTDPVPTDLSTTSGPAATEGGGTTSTGAAAKDQAQQTAGTAADEGKHVAGVALGEAKQVAGEARQQAQNLLAEARSQVDEQARTQRDRLVSTLQQFSGQLDGMADGDGAPSGIAQDAVRQVADRARDLTSRLDGREPGDLLEDVRSFARRKPGTFLLGAVAAGLVAGRLTRGAKAAQGSDTAGTGGTPGTTAHLGADPVAQTPVTTRPAPVGTPVSTPVTPATVTDPAPGTGIGTSAPYSGTTGTQAPL